MLQSVQEVALIFVGFLFLMTFTQNEVSTQKIIIVGSGLSGISAASKLIENDRDDVTILEAGTRMGGRIFSIPYGDGNIDLGAQWCHGSGGNIIYNLVSSSFSFGDTGIDNTDPLFYLSTGQLANQAQCMKLTSLAENILEDYTSMEKHGGSLGIYFITKYLNTLKGSAYSAIPIALRNQILKFIHTDVVTDFASPTWFNVSAKLNALSSGTTGNQYLTWQKSGFKTVFDYITKKLPSPSEALDVESKILYKKEVTNIKYNPSSSVSKVTVTCSDGSSYTADHVIFTGSLGVLKARHETLFTPGLPARNVKAIKNIGFGTLGKIFLEFDVPFWSLDRTEFVGFSFLWTEAQYKSVRNSDRAWLTNINSFLIVDGFPNLIETLVAGDKIGEFEALSDEKLVADCMWYLETFLGRDLPEPKSMRRTRWRNNKHFLGSYSYLSLTTAENNVSPRDLAQSVLNVAKKPVVMFAGEATDYKFSSYAHGAVSSGYRAANELLAYFTKNGM